MSGSQVSVVQGSPSSQALELSVWTHPVAGSQVSVVQRFASVHEIGSYRHAPVPGSHESTVHALPSSQRMAL